MDQILETPAPEVIELSLDELVATSGGNGAPIFF